ncbi:PQQ-binding-like beta-propeller repeat protein [Propionibacteriaceae bacterium Y2011]|uniref:outer membrane protein assembly factor BamB family protein n=1 Tax=Microlunatus sp. Y2014 TaxID=3418488 RepID=UPI003B4DEA2D
MSRSGGDVREPWAPFPVQDWNSYAATSSWRRSRVPHRVAVVVVCVVTALVLGVIGAAELVPRGVANTGGVNGFLPTDGDALTLHAADRGGSGGTGGDAVHVETSLGPGPATSQAMGWKLGGLTISSVGEALVGATVWRRLITPASGAGVPADGELQRDQQVEGYLVDEAIALIGRSYPEPHAFLPPIVLLPAGAEPDRQWQQTGVTTDGTPWHAELRSSGLADDCVRVAGEVTIGPDTEAVVRDWCPGRGIVAEAGLIDGAPRSVGASVLPPVDTVIRTPDTSPDTWQETPLATVGNPIGERFEPMWGTAQPLPPLPTPDGGLIRVSNAGDLVVFARNGDTLRPRLSLHPGGRVMTATIFGEVVVATTSRRQVVAWSTRTGHRLWVNDLADVVEAAPRRLDDTAIVFANLAGTVLAVDLRTGAERWRRDLSSGSIATLAVGGSSVALIGMDFSLTLLEADTGASRWDTTVSDYRSDLLIAAGAVWVADGQVLARHDLGDGSRTAQLFLDSATDALLWHNDEVVLATVGGLLFVDPAGRVAGTAPYRCPDLTRHRDDLVCWNVGVARVIGADHRERSSFEIPYDSVSLEVSGSDHEPWLVWGSAWKAMTWQS